jgi:hypothetical protein
MSHRSVRCGVDVWQPLGDDEDDGSNEHDSRTGGGNGIVDDFPV